MKYTKVLNPQWANEEHTAIYCMVDFDDLSEELVPFAAVASGDYPHTHQIFEECVAGKYGTIAEYVPPSVTETVVVPEKTQEQLLAQIEELAAQVQAME